LPASRSVGSWFQPLFSRPKDIFVNFSLDAYPTGWWFYHVLPILKNISIISNGKDDIPYMKWTKNLFETTNQPSIVNKNLVETTKHFTGQPGHQPNGACAFGFYLS